LDRTRKLIAAALGVVAAIVLLYLYFESRKVAPSPGKVAPSPGLPPGSVQTKTSPPPLPEGQSIVVQTSQGPVVAQTTSSGGSVPNVTLPDGTPISGVGYIQGQSAPGSVQVNYIVPPGSQASGEGDLLLIPSGVAAGIYGVSDARGKPALYADVANPPSGPVYFPLDPIFKIVSVVDRSTRESVTFTFFKGFVQADNFVYV